MTDEEFFLAIEKLNKEKKEILQGKEYKLGSRLSKWFESIKKLKFSYIYKDLKNKFIFEKMKKKFSSPPKDNILPNIKMHESYFKAKIIVYTCIVGNYDNLSIPLVTFDNVDMYLITDDPDKYKDYKKYYKIIKLSDEILSKGTILANRYVKFHPKEFFKEYDFSIYMDGNIRVISDVRKFILSCNTVTGIAMHLHKSRICVYDEAEACIIQKRGDSKKIKQQILNYKAEGFPRKFGLNEANIIAVDLNNVKSEELLDTWWKEFTKSESLRDQLAWPYVLWKKGYQIEDVGILGFNETQNPKLEKYKHS